MVSNQYLFDNTTPLADLGGLTSSSTSRTHWIYTDHNQFVTASAGGDLPILRPPRHGGGNVRRGRNVADLQLVVRHAGSPLT